MAAPIKITRQSVWMGNGFGTETIHTARQNGIVVGTFRRGSSGNWAGATHGILCMTYVGWRKALARLNEETR